MTPSSPSRSDASASVSSSRRVRSLLALVAVSGLLSACTMLQDLNVPGFGPDFSLEPEVVTLDVFPSTEPTQARVNLTVERKNGHAREVAISASDLPTGVSADVLVVEAEETYAPFPLTIESDASFAEVPVTFTATDGRLVHSTQVTLSTRIRTFDMRVAQDDLQVIVDADSVDTSAKVTVTRQPGHQGIITVSARDLPDGVSSEPITLQAGTNEALVPFTIEPEARLTNEEIVLEAADGTYATTRSIHLTTLHRTFAFDTEESTLQAVRDTADHEEHLGVRVSRAYNHSRPIYISATNVPDGVTIPAIEILEGEAGGTLDVTIRPDAVLGEHRITLTASDGVVTRSLSIDLVIRVPSGTYDETFGKDGLVLVDPMGEMLHGTAVATLEDGSVIVAGTHGIGQEPETSIFFARFDSDGNLDTSIGDDGILLYPHTTAPGGEVMAMVARGTRAYLAVNRADEGFNRDGVEKIMAPTGAYLLKIRLNGTPDINFGSLGRVDLDVPSSPSHAQPWVGTLHVDSEGNVLAAGYGGVDEQGAMHVWRFYPDGSPDVGFGHHGTAAVSLQPDTHARDMLVTPEGDIVVAATAFSAGGPYPVHAIVVRLNPDGTPDAAFGQNGRYVHHDGGYAYNSAEAIVLHEGKILVAGGTGGHTPETEFATYGTLFRLNHDGTRDMSFGDSGSTRVSFPHRGTLLHLAVQDDGQIVALGKDVEFAAVLRFEDDGMVDESFTADGRVTLNASVDANAAFNGVPSTPLVLTDAGKIVVVAGNHRNLELARLWQ